MNTYGSKPLQLSCAECFASLDAASEGASVTLGTPAAEKTLAAYLELAYVKPEKGL